MRIKDWVRLPSEWILHGGLKEMKWESGQGSGNTAALMVLTAIAHHSDDYGLAKLTYEKLTDITTLSRDKVSEGLDILEKLKIIDRQPRGRSTYQLTEYRVEEGWVKLPARNLYSSESIIAFRELRLRRAVELYALKLFFLFLAMRDRKTNIASIGYDKISEYSGVKRNFIKSAISFLTLHQLVYVEPQTRQSNDQGIYNAYRIVHLEPYNHVGTKGYRERPTSFDPVTKQ